MSKKQYHNHFERRERILYKGSPDEKTQTFYVCKDDCPAVLQDFVYRVHKEYFESCLPNDWVYDTIHSAFLDLADNELDDIHLEADPYYSQLYEWFGNPYADYYCERVIADRLAHIDRGIYDIIGWAQWQAKQNIYYAVNEFMQEE